MPNYRWEKGSRVSVQDGVKLLKTNEAASLLSISVEDVRTLVREGLLDKRGTYPFQSYGRNALGWLVSEQEVNSLKDHPQVALLREQLNIKKAKLPKKKITPKAMVKPVKKSKQIRPDQFQVQALENARQDRNVLLVAPTGAGKTWVAEELAKLALAKGMGLMFASPIKALSNQKYREFAAIFGEEQVGIITGDVSINTAAPVIILTTEILRNKCMSTPEDLTGVRWIVLDEFHLIDSDRGAAWEDAVIFAPLEINIVCLSATVPNYREIALWIEEVRRRTVTVVLEERRPVPISWRWFIKNRVVTEKKAGEAVARLQAEKALRRRSGRGRNHYSFYDYYDFADEYEDSQPPPLRT